MTYSTLVLGADGGGTKTMGLLADRTGAILARALVGGSNQNVIGTENVAENLAGLVLALTGKVGRPASEIGAAVLGLAGSGSESERQALVDAIRARLGARGIQPFPLLVKSDVRIALEGAFDGGPGVVAIAGTGSVVMGKTPSGKTLRVGGWGRLLGDEGSGYSIGLEALKAVSLDLEARGEAGLLRVVLANRFGLDTRARIIAAVYREKFDIPSVAPAVLEAASSGDEVSGGILRRASLALSAQVVTAVERLGLGDGTGVVLVGGLISHENVYARMLADDIRAACPYVSIRPPQHGPAHGALLMALAGAREVET